MTYNTIKQEKKKIDQDHNLKTFGNTVIGVHGQELPKFSETQKLKEYWKNRDESYIEHPKQTSLLEFKQNVKYWAKPDEFMLADGKESPPPPDPLKKFESLPEKKPDCATKINNIPYPASISNEQFGPLKVPTVFIPRFKSVYSENPMERLSYINYENEKMYSSFTPNNIFKEPYPIIHKRFIIIIKK